MVRRVFFSFNFKEDHWRAAMVRGIGSVEGNAELTDNEWEAVKKKGDAAVEKWIDEQMQGKSCVVVLAGANTANRPWIDYEIKQAWKLKKGLVGIRIHKLLNSQRLSSVAGTNPFEGFKLGEEQLSSIVTLYDPPGVDSKAAYKSISNRYERRRRQGPRCGRRACSVWCDHPGQRRREHEGVGRPINIMS